MGTIRAGSEAETYGTNDDDTIYGTSANNDLWAKAGWDRLFGGRGNDRLYGESGNDYLSGNDGTDFLYGGLGNDTMLGGAGNDRLEGGASYDRYTGGSGADRFVFASMGDANTDVITDFSGRRGGQGDRVDFSAIDANVNKAGNQAFFEYTGTGKQPVGSFTFSLDRDGNTDVRLFDGKTYATFELTGDIWIEKGDFIV